MSEFCEAKRLPGSVLARQAPARRARNGRSPMQVTRRNLLTGVGAAVAGVTTATVPTFAAWEPNLRYPDPAVKILDPSFAKYRIGNAGVERLATGMRFGEG